MKFISLLAVIVIGILVYTKTSSQTVSPVVEQISTQGSRAPETTISQAYLTIEDDGHEIAYEYISRHPSEVTLFSNVQDAIDSTSAMLKNTCDSLVSAGFYTKELKHLGQFVSEGTLVQSSISSTLVDGFLAISTANITSIGFEKPSDEMRIVLQSGPIVRSENKIRPLRLIEDEFARRMVAGISTDGSLVFLALFMKNQEYSGPLLSRVPTIVEKISQREKLELHNALNLDGGSASAFITKSRSLTEIKPLGGYFCIREKN